MAGLDKGEPQQEFAGSCVRLNKVLRLRRAIEEGRYAVDAGVVADCILRAFQEGQL